jgi:predicted ATPase
MTKKEEAMAKLREAAALLAEAAADPSFTRPRYFGQVMTFPGWDFENVTPEDVKRAHSIRDAAVAIVNTTNYDDSVVVPVASVANLVRFIGDMLED